MNTSKELFLTVTNFHGIKDNINTFFYVIAQPVARTIEFAEKRKKKESFSLFAFGLTIYMAISLLNFTGIEFGVFSQLAIPIIGPIIFVAIMLFFLYVTFQVFSRISTAGRTSDEFVIVSATYSGVCNVLSTPVFLISVISLSIGTIFGLALWIYIAVYSVVLMKTFWDIPYWKAIVYPVAIVIGISVIFSIIMVILLQ